ncbi:MAG TPA: hypothetical protein DDW84_02205 [Phycisphaerales bacterium]|nr:MAG: hypothetical protein A2Y13_02715 [Planctomycetes bacterium GWC2_45_44]HBG77649.1 hypothetical protein [Phycisphaerales bacterium]HBR20858.1 hypothetical protein [Phycisphaerales bacterium]
MANQPRAAKILVSLVAAMTVGAAVLMTLDHQSISAGAFSLASYSSLGSIGDVIAAKEPAKDNRWTKIEIFYSNTKGGDIKQLASLSGLTNADDLNFHFLVCNGLGTVDGQIQPTEKWLNQWSALPGGVWYGSTSTIRVCIIGEANKTTSDYQISRTEELIDALSRRFNIARTSITYPQDWRL